MIEFDTKMGGSPLLVAAIHNGHRIRAELLPYLKLTDKEREREEDPYTASLTDISDNSLTVFTSRFEVDINRPREKAIYQLPADAWGLELYNEKLPDVLVQQSLQYYDEFYIKVGQIIKELLANNRWLIVYDLHTYNHRRNGYDRYAPPEANPEVNIGPGNVISRRWQCVIECLTQKLSEYNFEGRNLDVRENVKFKGGYFTAWLSRQFGNRVCPIAIEFKKFFMDEWTGKINSDQLSHLRHLLISTIHPIIKKIM
jgi:N-formylglutamate amidohydrolase